VAKSTAHARESRAACEFAFAFLVDDFGYRRCVRRFQYGGFQLCYRGPDIGVLVEWYPRDLLPTSLSDDQAAPLYEHGSAAVDDHGAGCSAVLADPDSAIYRRVKWRGLLTVRDCPRADRRAAAS
jgi:hypothetical protein